MKYDSLKSKPHSEITGKRYSEEYSNMLWRGDRLTIIRGFPPCPECGCTLARDWSNISWICPECETIYTTSQLVQAIETENALTYVSVRNLID